MASGFKNVRELVLAEDNGNYKIAGYHKTPTQTTAAGFWFDLSMSPGNPIAQYYAATPLVAQQMKRSTEGGLDHGGSVSPAKKYLRRLAITTGTSTVLPARFILCDYLLYYPFIDESVTEEQTLTNSVSLPRFTDGKGVQAMAVAVAAQVGGVTFTMNYTNSAGVAGRVSPACTLNTQAVNGTIVTAQNVTTASGSIPFIPLAAGDSGIQSVQSVTMGGADIGLFALVLVKPLANIPLLERTSPVEIDYFKDFTIVPEIQDDAYLNFICCPGGTVASSRIFGTIEVSWN